MADRKPRIRTTKVDLLEVFPNPYPGRIYDIAIEAPEFTSVCPKTGQPDYATLLIAYVPDRACIELKSLKLYLQQYRNRGIFYEEITNRILDDLTAACSPRYMRLESRWRPRGGISTSVAIEYGAR
jgi:7-cyano-7-deazaguanine reductase